MEGAVRHEHGVALAAAAAQEPAAPGRDDPPVYGDRDVAPVPAAAAADEPRHERGDEARAAAHVAELGRLGAARVVAPRGGEAKAGERAAEEPPRRPHREQAPVRADSE